MDDRPQSPRVVGVFLVSAALLIIEIAYTRIFSIRFWNHFAALSVSVALLGLGAAGAVLYLRPRLARREFSLALAFAAANVVGLALTCSLPFDIFRVTNPVTPVLFYASLVLPFLTAGLYLSSPIALWPRQANRIYAWNLGGTACGVLLAVLLIPRMGALGAIVAASLLGLLAAVLATPSRRVRTALALLGLLLGGLAWQADDVFPVALPQNKMLYGLTQGGHPPLPRLLTRWDATSRVDLVGPAKWGAWGLAEAHHDNLPAQILVTLDGDALTPVTAFGGDPGGIQFLRHTLSALPFVVRPPRSVLVLGSGGGPDLLTAWLFGSRRLVGVDFNSTLIDLLRGDLRGFSGNFLERLEVEQAVVDGRNYVRRSGERFDVIQIPLVDSFAATFSGGFALSENFVYTREAFEDYFEHLTEGGILNLTRFDDPSQRRQVLRLLRLAAEVAGPAGLEHLERNVIVAHQGEVMNVLISRTPLLPEEKARAEEFCRENGFKLLFLDGVQSDPLILQSLTRPDEFERSQFLDFSVPTDDHPSFNQFHRFSRLPDYVVQARSGSVPVVFLALGWMLALALGACTVLVVLPLVLGGRGRPRPGKGPLLYFSALGLGFMLLEVGLFQQFGLFLGHPTWSLSVVLFTLVLCTGAGSALGGYIPRGAESRGVVWAVAGILLLCVAARAGLAPLLDHCLAWPLPGRILLAGALLAPLGLLLGIPFPTAIRRHEDPSQVAWFWGMNACASVLGSTLATISSLAWGYGATLMLGAACYALAALQAATWRGSGAEG